MALETFINGDKQEKGKKRGRSLRFDLDLVPPTEEFTNEFSYTDLVEGGERKVSPWVVYGAQNGCGRENAPGGPNPTSQPCGCNGCGPLEKPGFRGFGQNLTPALVSQGEGPTKLGETLETGTDNQLAALAQRLEQKYGVRKFDMKRVSRGRSLVQFCAHAQRIICARNVTSYTQKLHRRPV